MNGIQIEYLNLQNLLQDARPVPYRALANLKVKNNAFQIVPVT